MVRVPTHRAPTHPGEMLLEEFLNPMDLTQRDLAEAIHVPYQRVNELINGRRGITPSTALRLAKFFWHVPGFLDEPAAALGPVPRAQIRGGGPQADQTSATSCLGVGDCAKVAVIPCR